MVRRLIATLIFCAVITLLFHQFYHFLKNRIAISDLKAVTEKRISTFLKAPVRVNQISVGLLKHISLSGLEISQNNGNHPMVIGINKIVVRYDLLSFIKRNFKVPAEIFLSAPRMTLDVLRNPDNFFDMEFLKSKHGILTRFEFDEGIVELPWLRNDEKLRFEDLEGQLVPKKGEMFDVRFKSKLAGVASGSILGFGETSMNKSDYQLQLDLNQVVFSEESRIPIRDLNGKIEVENDVLKIHETKFLLREIPCQLSGEVRRLFAEDPAYALKFSLHEKNVTIRTEVMIDFKTKVIEGLVHVPFAKYEFSGKIEGKPADFKITSLTVNDIYLATAHFDSVNRAYQVKWNKGDERYEAHFSVADFTWMLNLKLNHFQLFDHDLVTSAMIRLTPDETLWKEGKHVFQTEIETDYVIFEYHPLRDFKASASVSVNGIEDLVANWGTVSELRGTVSFGPIPKTHATLRIAPIPLSEIASLGMHALPMSLDGMFEGQMDMEGAIENPTLKGSFTVKEGSIGSFKYDRAVLNFSGRMPYLVLSDSKVWLGKNSFRLNGGLDFARSNVFEGIEIDNFENVVIWKGLEVSSSLKKIPDPEMLEAALKNSKARVQADYKITDRSSFQITAEEDQSNKEYVTAGPKLKF